MDITSTEVKPVSITYTRGVSGIRDTVKGPCSVHLKNLLEDTIITSEEKLLKAARDALASVGLRHHDPYDVIAESTASILSKRDVDLSRPLIGLMITSIKRRAAHLAEKEATQKHIVENINGGRKGACHDYVLEDDLLDIEEQRLVREAMLKLNNEQMMALALTADRGLSLKETAKRLGWGEKKVRVKLDQSSRVLREFLRASSDGEVCKKAMDHFVSHEMQGANLSRADKYHLSYCEGCKRDQRVWYRTARLATSVLPPFFYFAEPRGMGLIRSFLTWAQDKLPFMPSEPATQVATTGILKTGSIVAVCGVCAAGATYVAVDNKDRIGKSVSSIVGAGKSKPAPRQYIEPVPIQPSPDVTANRAKTDNQRSQESESTKKSSEGQKSPRKSQSTQKYPEQTYQNGLSMDDDGEPIKSSSQSSSSKGQSGVKGGAEGDDLPYDSEGFEPEWGR